MGWACSMCGDWSMHTFARSRCRNDNIKMIFREIYYEAENWTELDDDTVICKASLITMMNPHYTV